MDYQSSGAFIKYDIFLVIRKTIKIKRQLKLHIISEVIDPVFSNPSDIVVYISSLNKMTLD